jgi:AmiR/NasT family two-component response regulator
VLLGVHRGGRQKAKAVQQIAHAIVENPARSETLLPVLAVAVRSVRGPEARAGLAAVVSVVEALPQLADAVRRLLPEMKLAEVAA